jgi:hypothetical protein
MAGNQMVVIHVKKISELTEKKSDKYKLKCTPVRGEL